MPRLDDYTVGDRIRETLSGPVYLATENATGEPVEIKMLPPANVRDALLRLRIRRETATLRRLHHPNLVKVLEICDDPEKPFLVLEHVSGTSMSQWLARLGRAPVLAAVNVHLRILDGVAALHEAGVLHRDIQPEHVVIGDDGRVVLRGFGSVKIIDGADGDMDETGTGTLSGGFGDPSTRAALYRAPEALEREAGVTADVYSVAICLYEALAGQLPFSGNPTEQVLARMQMPPHPLIQHRPGIPPGVHENVMRMLAPDPADRFASAREARAAFTPELLARCRVSDIRATERLDEETKSASRSGESPRSEVMADESGE